MIDLEDIASKLQERAVKETNDTGSLVNKHTTDLGEDFGIKNKSHHHRIKCDLCGKQFMNIFDLEEHIKIQHEEYQTYKCEVCSKTFITNWRLQKHEKMHLKDNIKHYHYYKHKKHCP